MIDLVIQWQHIPVMEYCNQWIKFIGQESGFLPANEEIQSRWYNES